MQDSKKSKVVNLEIWKSKHRAKQKSYWRVMTDITRHKTLTVKEVLEYVAFAIWTKDLPEEFDGEITCEMNDDGSVDVYAIEKDTTIEKAPN